MGDKNDFGKYAFLAAVAISALGAFWPSLLFGMGVLLLFVLGLVVGVANIEKSEEMKAILVLIAFPLVALGLNAGVPQLSAMIGPILINFSAALGGAAVVIVGKALHNTFVN